MHDAGLYLGRGVDGRDGLGEALEAVHHGDQDVSHPPILPLGHHPHPEFSPFGLLDPQPQHLFDALHIYAQGHVERLVLDHAFVANLYPQGVEDHHGIDVIQGAAPATP